MYGLCEDDLLECDLREYDFREYDLREYDLREYDLREYDLREYDLLPCQQKFVEEIGKKLLNFNPPKKVFKLTVVMVGPNPGSGSGIRKIPFPDPGVQKAPIPDNGSRIRIRNTDCHAKFVQI